MCIVLFVFWLIGIVGLLLVVCLVCWLFGFLVGCVCSLGLVYVQITFVGGLVFILVVVLIVL